MRWTATFSNTTSPASARTGRWRPSARCVAKGCVPEQVRAIRLKVDAGADAMCNIAAPRTGLEAKFSLRFNAALALHGVDTSDSATYADPSFSALTSRPRAPSPRSNWRRPDWPEDVTEVTITTRDGDTFVQRHDISVPPGDIPMQGQRLRAKFMALATPVIGADRAEALADAIRRMEDQDDVSKLFALATPL
jgi:2-methylcitrate dehydratase PrpD